MNTDTMRVNNTVSKIEGVKRGRGGERERERPCPMRHRDQPF